MSKNIIKIQKFIKLKFKNKNAKARLEVCAFTNAVKAFNVGWKNPKQDRYFLLKSKINALLK